MSRKPNKTDDVIGYHRANRVGLLLIIMTVCLYGVPLLMRAVLRQCGLDMTAAMWGLSSGEYTALYLLTYVLMLGIPFLLGKFWLLPKSTHHLSPLNLSHDRRICVVLCGVALCLVANIISVLIEDLVPIERDISASFNFFGNGDIGMLLAALFVFAIVPAVIEEMLLRGIILQTLRPIGRFAAVGVSSLLFSLMHGNPVQLPYTLMMGIVLGAVFVHTDDLRLTIVIHALANSLSLITAFILEFSDSEVAMFWELVIVVVALMMGGVAGLWLLSHPLERSQPQHTASVSARAKGLFSAPLLWLAIGLMLLMLILFM